MRTRRSCPPEMIWMVCLVVSLFVQNADAQQRGHFRVTVSTDAVHVIVADPLGRRAGSDPRGAPDPAIGIEINEIPDAVYAAETVGDIPENEGDSVRVDYVHVLTYAFDHPIDGTHAIQVIGVKNSPFNLYVSVTPDDDREGLQYFRAEDKGVVQKDSVVEYRLHYQSQPGTPVAFEKVVDLTTLRRDIVAAYSANLLGDVRLLDEWNKAIGRIARRLSSGDSIKARQDLEHFDTSLEKEYRESEKHQLRGEKVKRFITTVAYEILKADVSVLFGNWSARVPK